MNGHESSESAFRPESTSLVDFLIEQKNRNQKYFLDYMKYASFVKEVALQVLKQKKSEIRVLVFVAPQQERY